MAAVGPHSDGLGAGVSAELPDERSAVPFAGVYAVTMAMGGDTVHLFIGIPAQAEFRPLAARVRAKGEQTLPAPFAGLVMGVFVGTDSAALLPASGTDRPASGYMIAVPEGAPGGAGTRWWVTILAGTDTTGGSGASRLSLALLRLYQRRERLELTCLTDPNLANESARRRHEPALCDPAARLPLHRDDSPGDGVLVLGADGRARLEQHTETEGGELTMWGSRVTRFAARGFSRAQ